MSVQDAGDEELITINELCPRCRTLLHMTVRHDETAEAVICPACDGALLWTGDRRKEALITLTRGSVGSGCLAMTFYMLCSTFMMALSVLLVQWSPALSIIMSLTMVLALVLGMKRLTNRFGRPTVVLLNLLSGRQLAPATYRDERWIIDAVPPPPATRKRRDDETLDGGLHLLDSDDDADQRGRLTDAAEARRAGAITDASHAASPHAAHSSAHDASEAASAVVLDLDLGATAEAKAEVSAQASNGHQRPS